MTYFEVLSVGFLCLVDFSVLGHTVRGVPEPLRPLAAVVRIADATPLCRMIPEVERFPARPAAIRRVLELGPGRAPRLRFCRGWKCWDKAITWTPKLFVDGQEIKGGSK